LLGEIDAPKCLALVKEYFAAVSGTDSLFLQRSVPSYFAETNTTSSTSTT
jgi:hypothetical protein